MHTPLLRQSTGCIFDIKRLDAWVQASDELEALGCALGEALMAADLAALISHKRQADGRRASGSSYAKSARQVLIVCNASHPLQAAAALTCCFVGGQWHC